MFTILKKEINGFFSTITGYIVILVFVVINSLFMWIFESEFNVLDNGYANIDTLFTIAPWVFLFLVPAITMRLFSDEKKSGTMELLLTKPLTDMQIILGKYFAGVILVLMALLPTAVFYVSVYLLGNPAGNIDTGGTLGSYIGLFFLASVYVAIGLFASSLTENQIISFILAMLVSFFMYIGFESISSMFETSGAFIANLGINEHYRSLSRGVIDTRDLLYFGSAATVFLLFTKTVLESRKW